VRDFKSTKDTIINVIPVSRDEIMGSVPAYFSKLQNTATER
jgi:hypothetical protein